MPALERILMCSPGRSGIRFCSPPAEAAKLKNMVPYSGLGPDCQARMKRTYASGPVREAIDAAEAPSRMIVQSIAVDVDDGPRARAELPSLVRPLPSSLVRPAASKKVKGA